MLVSRDIIIHRSSPHSGFQSLVCPSLRNPSETYPRRIRDPRGEVALQIAARSADNGGMAKLQASPFVGQLSGSMANLAFRSTATGVQMIARTRPRDPRTPAQVAARQRMTQVAGLWRGMTLEQAAAWRAYALELAEPLHPAPNAFNLFAALAVRVLAVRPAAVVPLVPPAQPFAGDAVRVTISGAPGAVVVSPSAGNAPGVVTEILVQSLATVHRAAYAEKYRSAGFFSLVAGAAVSLPRSPGPVAVALRVVRVDTGQAGPLLELGRVVVG